MVAEVVEMRHKLCTDVLKRMNWGWYCPTCKYPVATADCEPEPVDGQRLVVQLDVLNGMAAVLAEGSKHDVNEVPGWVNGVDVAHELEKADKHLQAWRDGERIDDDSGQHPLLHTIVRLCKIIYAETHDGR